MKLELNFTKKEKILKKDNYQLNADFYWRIILYIALVLIIGSMAFGFMLFQKTNQALELTSEYGTSNPVVVKKERIEKVLEIFSERKSKTMQIITYPAEVVDPSL